MFFPKIDEGFQKYHQLSMQGHDFEHSQVFGILITNMAFYCFPFNFVCILWVFNDSAGTGDGVPFFPDFYVYVFLDLSHLSLLDFLV